MIGGNGEETGKPEDIDVVEMALHQANARRPHPDQDRRDRAKLIETVIKSDLETDDPGLENLKARDFPLANYDEEADPTEFKWMQEILSILSKARYPHPRSGLQGIARAWAAGDPEEDLTALGPEQLAADEAFLLGTYSRATRGEAGMQQEVSAKQVTESHAYHDGGRSNPGGLLGRIRDR